MTYGELKLNLVSLGFEEETILEEYAQIIVDATNEALRMIYYDVVQQLIGYYKRTEPKITISSVDEHGSTIIPFKGNDTKITLTVKAKDDGILVLDNGYSEKRISIGKGITTVDFDAENAYLYKNLEEDEYITAYCVFPITADTRDPDDYFTLTAKMEWVNIPPELVTLDSDDEMIMELPDNIIALLPILTAYMVWLDDDVVKATYYWNMYETFRERIIGSCLSTVKARIEGGVKW